MRKNKIERRSSRSRTIRAVKRIMKENMEALGLDEMTQLGLFLVAAKLGKF